LEASLQLLVLVLLQQVDSEFAVGVVAAVDPVAC
jgi:hypothetical protein